MGEPTGEQAARLRRAGILLACADLLWIGQAGVIAFVLGRVLEAEVANATTPGPDLYPLAAWSFVGLVALAGARMFLQNHALDTARIAARDIKRCVRSDLMRAAARRSPSEEFPASGAFAAHVGDQVDLLGPYYRNYVPQIMRLKIVPVAILLVTLPVSWIAALILLVCGPVIPLFMALIGMRAQAASQGQQEELTRLGGLLLDRVKGLETLKLFGAVGRTKDDIRAAGEDFRIGTMKVLKIAFLSSTVLELFSALGIAFCAVYVGFTLLGDIAVGTWGSPLSYTTGLFILLLAPEFFAPLRAFAAAYHDRAAGLAAQEKLTDLFAEEIGHNDTEQPTAMPVSVSSQGLQTAPEIEFENVTLAFDGTHVFEDFSLTVPGGGTLVVNGASGAGKTTLLDCVLGFQSLQAGHVRIGGHELSAGLAAGLRQRVMWLGQSPKLFHGSVRANLLRGAAPRAEVAEEDLWTALELAGVDTLVRQLPDGLATQLGEDGFGFSVGEIRRIALARAAIRRDAVMLLADEPTAGLDAETAADVRAGLNVLAKGRTALIATHDPLFELSFGRKSLVDLSAVAGCSEAAQ
ncbi:thiol reductant ABC exporter subunit CydD [Roseibium denhamense]|uniref:ATP-binding cassette, subfamily C, CydD n=2 Tax=Roseibium denhamense TaxID=76305 RepID=A0ABY1NST3_9HYPH|nr:ATP-binding cassette, subfamily C, CydD [Roseibium denhamense]